MNIHNNCWLWENLKKICYFNMKKKTEKDTNYFVI